MCSSGLTGKVYSDHLAPPALVTQGTAFTWLLPLSVYKHGVAKWFFGSSRALTLFSEEIVLVRYSSFVSKLFKYGSS